MESNVSTKTSNFSQVVWLVVGQLSAYVSVFLSAAILSRYLTKQDYGTYRQILFVYTTLMSVFAIGLPKVFSYYIPRLQEGQQKTLVNGMNRLFLLLGGGLSLALFFGSSVISNLLNNPELEEGIKIFSIFPLFTFPALGVEGIYTALRKTKEFALYHFLSRMLMLLFTVLPVMLFEANYKIALIGWGVSSFLIFIYAMYMKNKPYLKVKKEVFQDMYKHIFNYSLPLAGAFIAGFFIVSADQFYISHFFGTEAFAEYSNGNISIPVTIVIAMSIKQVLLPLFSKAQSEGRINEALKSYGNAVKGSVVVVFPILVFAIIFAEEIMIILYGHKYVNSQTYMRYYLIRDFFEIIPYFSVLLALGKTKLYMYMHIVGALYVWGLNYILISMGFGATVVVAVATSFHVLNRIFGVIYIYQVQKINLLSNDLIRRILLVLLHSSICAIITYVLIDLFHIKSMLEIYALTIGFLMFYIMLIFSGFLLKINYLESLQLLLNKK